LTILDRMNLRPLPVFAAGDTQGGGGGSDTTKAGGGDDTAKGGAGDDTAKGGGGDDTSGGGDQPDPLEKWRDLMADGDTELANELKRSKTMKDFGKRFKDMRTKLSKGAALAEDEMPDEAKDPDGAKAWREARGVPDKPTGYELPDTVQKKLTDEDKPIVDDFMAKAHKLGWSKPRVAEAVQWYTDLQEAVEVDRHKADEIALKDAKEALRSDWGPDNKANTALVEKTAAELVPGVDWFEARLPDGRLLKHIPEVANALLEIGQWKFGDLELESGKGGGGKNRREELRGLMKADIKEWRRHPEWARELQTLEEKAQARDNRSR
jgi:Ca2+-binding RTX toxin-like protein